MALIPALRGNSVHGAGMPTVEELRSELGKRKLPTDGLKAVLEQRLSVATQQESKRVKTAMNSIADEWVCPISQELPIDPVMAEDGKIYERAAIAKWLAEHQRSPSTGMAMGTKLVPSPQVRNTLEHLVQSGAIDGDKAVAWKAKLKNKQKVKELRAKADAGDADAMDTLGVLYTFGDAGLVKDQAQGRAWYERAAELGHPYGMARLGQSLLKGHGGPSNPALGLVYATRAAEAGSDLAAFQLGKAFVKGKHGLSQNSALAKHYLHKIVEGECTLKHLIEKCHTEAKELLEQLN